MKLKLVKAVSIAGLLSVSYVTQASEVTEAFASGEALTAAKMNSIRSAVNDNDSRVSALESANPVVRQTVAIDCSDPDTLLNTVIKGKTTYILSGMCNGPIDIRGGDIKIKGDDIGVKDDGIFLPPGLNTNPYAALGVHGDFLVELENLTISAGFYSDNTSWSVAALNAGHGSRIEISDTDFIGGRNGISSFMGSRVRTWNNVEIKEFGRYGVNVSRNSIFNAQSFITILGKVSSVETRGYGIGSYDNSSATLNNGGTIVTPVGTYMLDLLQDRRSLTTFAGGSIKASKGNGASLSLTGRVFAGGSSSIEVFDAEVMGRVKAMGGSSVLLSGGTVSDQIKAQSSGAIQIENSAVISGDLVVIEASAAIVEGGATLNGGVDILSSSAVKIYDATISGNRLTAARSSSIQISTTTTAVDNINISSYSSLDLDSGNLGETVISCHDRTNQLSLGTASNFTYDLGCN